MSAVDLLLVACCEERAPAPVMAEYLKSFKKGMGVVQRKNALDLLEQPAGVAQGDRFHS